MFTQEDLQTASINDINNAIDKKLGGVDAPPPKKPFRTYRARRLAEGLQNIIYWCPKCNQEFTMETKGCMIRCTTCDNTAELDREMKLKPTSGSVAYDTIHDWYREQARYEAGQLNEDMEPINVKVSVRLPSEKPGGGMQTFGAGVVRLDPKGWHFDGEIKGEQVSLFFPIDTVPALPIDPDDVFQIYANGTFYMFSPEDTRKCIKYSVIGECAYWRFASRVQMTPRKDSGFC